MFDFDTVIDRRNTDSYKWDCNAETFGTEDVLPMWVADMDFACPPPLLDALEARIRHGILGYTSRSEGYEQAIISWLSRRHGWQVDRDWISYCPPGIMPSVCMLIGLLSQPNDRIIIQTPNYSSLMNAIKDSGRLMVENPLKFDGRSYAFDFDDLKTKSSNAKMLLLCNPNNPTGSVWSRDQLAELGDICAKNGVFVISDEVHCDLVYPGSRHTPFGALPGPSQEMSATCISPNKTFNVGGLLTSTIIIPNQILKERYEAELATQQIRLDNVFGRIAVETLYKEPLCEQWLEELLTYLEGNIDTAVARINVIPGLKTHKPQGTYLLWIDFSGLGLTDTALRRMLVHKAKLGLSDGLDFGSRFGQYMRMNIACPRQMLEEGLRRLEKACGA